MNADELKRVLKEHKKWLNGDGGAKADLHGLHLRDANLYRADFSHADLHGTNLSHADLSRANLSHADLHYSSLLHANLHSSNLYHADLHETDLSQSDLSNANLHDANMRDTCLPFSILNGADLRGADLRGASIDFSSWPLWCGTLGVKIDARIAAQLVYHAVRACQSVANDDDVAAFCNDPVVIKLANRFHHAVECGYIKADKKENN